MNKEQFNELDIFQQLEYVNNQLFKKESLRGIGENLKMSKTTFRDRFDKIGYKYNSEEKQYLKQDNITTTQIKHEDMLQIKHNHNIDDNTENSKDEVKEKDITQVKHDHNIKTLFNKSDIGALQELIIAKDELMELLKRANNERNAIELPEITIDTDRLKGDFKTRSYNLYESVIKEFTIFCNDNKQFTQKDLLSMAIIEYMNRYKK